MFDAKNISLWLMSCQFFSILLPPFRIVSTFSAYHHVKSTATKTEFNVDAITYQKLEDQLRQCNKTGARGRMANHVAE